MRTYRFKINEGVAKSINISFTPPVGTLTARCVATNSSGNSQTLSGAVVINGSTLEVTIPSEYAVYANFPSKFEIQLQVDGGAWYTDVEAYGYLIAAPVPASDVIGDVSSADAVIQSLLSSPTSGTKTAIDTLVDTAADDAVELAVETHTPGIELGSSSRTSTFTTTNTTAGNGSLGILTSLSVTVVGTGRPAMVSFYAPAVYHSVANTFVAVSINTGNPLAASNAQLGSIASTLTNNGPSLRVTLRTGTLTLGQSYTFQANVWGTAAGTSTLVAAAYCPIQLTVNAA